jgi:hypothetical protein
VLIGIVAIAVKTYTTYPILLFCGRWDILHLYTNLGIWLVLNKLQFPYL